MFSVALLTTIFSKFGFISTHLSVRFVQPIRSNSTQPDCKPGTIKQTTNHLPTNRHTHTRRQNNQYTCVRERRVMMVLSTNASSLSRNASLTLSVCRFSSRRRRRCCCHHCDTVKECVRKCVFNGVRIEICFLSGRPDPDVPARGRFAYDPAALYTYRFVVHTETRHLRHFE